MAELLDYLQRAVTDGASDLFLIAGGCVSEKVEGRICAISEEKVLPPETERLITGIYEMAGRDMGRYQTTGDDDFSFAVPGLARFRVNAYRQRGSIIPGKGISSPWKIPLNICTGIRRASSANGKSQWIPRTIFPRCGHVCVRRRM